MINIVLIALIFFAIVKRRRDILRSLGSRLPAFVPIVNIVYDLLLLFKSFKYPN